MNGTVVLEIQDAQTGGKKVIEVPLCGGKVLLTDKVGEPVAWVSFRSLTVM